MYGAAKFGIVGWSRALRIELARFGVGVVCVCPGRVETPFFDHETFARRVHRRETELTLPLGNVVGAILHAAVRNRALVTVPRYFAWLARAAAARGHRVTLCEASSRLGGQANLAALLPGRTEFGGIVTNLEREARTAGVDIRLNTRVDAALVASLQADVVIGATGGQPYRPAVEGAESAHVVDAWAVLEGSANVGGRVVVADWRCSPGSC